jgi:hypothetical protein
MSKVLNDEVKPTVSIDREDTRNSHSSAGARRINHEIEEVIKDINGVLTKALKKHKSADSTKKFLGLLEKTLEKDLASNYVATRLLITERLVQNMLPSMIDSLTMASSKFTKEHIEKTATEIFDNETYSVIVQLLGMEEDDWNKGNLKVNTCNGRKSAISAYITSHSQNIVDRIAKEALEEFDKAEVPKIKAKVSAGIIKRIKEQIEQQMWSATGERVEEQVTQITKSIVDKAMENHDVFKSLCSVKPYDE